MVAKNYSFSWGSRTVYWKVYRSIRAKRKSFTIFHHKKTDQIHTNSRANHSPVAFPRPLTPYIYTMLIFSYAFTFKYIEMLISPLSDATYAFPTNSSFFPLGYVYTLLPDQRNFQLTKIGYVFTPTERDLNSPIASHTICENVLRSLSLPHFPRVLVLCTGKFTGASELSVNLSRSFTTKRPIKFTPTRALIILR